MNLQSLFRTLCVFLFGILLMMPHASAGIAKDEVALGGVRPDMSIDYIRTVYGEPTRSERMAPGAWNYYYGDSVKIHTNNGNVITIKVTKDNGFRTPSGFHVGMNIDDVLSVYGAPERLVDYQEYGTEWAYEYHFYHVARYVEFRQQLVPSADMMLMFRTDAQKKILSISATIEDISMGAVGH